MACLRSHVSRVNRGICKYWEVSVDVSRPSSNLSIMILTSLRYGVRCRMLAHSGCHRSRSVERSPDGVWLGRPYREWAFSPGAR